jgi:outer membrane lipoprotein-sorting protein
MKKIMIVSAALLVLLTAGCTESMQRELKTMKSEYVGGLNRTASVYSGSGELIAQYQGKFDVQSSEYGNNVLFDVDGKRVIIYNATVIVEEQ